MLIRTCLAMLTAASLAMSLIPGSAACRGLSLQNDLPKRVEANRQQTTGTRGPGDDLAAEAPNSKQTPAQMDPRAEKVKRTVRRIGLASKITVFLKNGDDLHGATTVIDEHTFQLAEVDLHHVMTVDYVDVKKVRSGYGGINLFTGRRTSYPLWVQPVAVAAVLGLLIVPLFFLKD
jgi:hypothetical protein